MNTIKLIKLFLCLSPKERKEFGVLLEVGFFKKEKNNSSLVLFNGLNKLFKSRKCGREGLRLMSVNDLAKVVFPSESLSNSKLNKIFNGLVTQIMSYLAFKKMDGAENATKKQFSLSIYKDRKLNDIALQTASNRIEALETRSEKWSNVKENYIWLNVNEHKELAYLKHYIYTYPLPDQNKKEQHILQDIQNHQMMAHSLAMLQLCCSQLMRSKEYKTYGTSFYIDKAIEITQLYQSKANRLVQLYLQSIIALQNPSDKLYSELKKTFYDNKAHLSREDQCHIVCFLFTIAYLLSIKSTNNECYLKECYQMMKSGFSKKIFIKNNYLNADLFINYIVICGEYQQMILNKQKSNPEIETSLPNLYQINLEYSKHLSDEDKEITEYLATAIIHYYDKRHAKCLEMMNNYLSPQNPKKSNSDDEKKLFHTYKREADKLYIRSLRLRAYFEDEDEHIFNHCRAFQEFLANNKNNFSDTQIETNQCFLELTKKILTLQQRKNHLSKKSMQQAQNHLKDEINSSELLVCRSWLLKQVDNLQTRQFIEGNGRMKNQPVTQI